MDYRTLVSSIPVSKWNPLSSKLVDFILTSKNDEKMPSQLANTILHHWQNDTLVSELGLAALLEAALLLEPDKTTAAFAEMELAHISEQIKDITPKT